MEDFFQLSALAGALPLIGAFLFHVWAQAYINRRYEAELIARRFDRMMAQQKQSDKARELRREVDRLFALAKGNLRRKAKKQSRK